MGKAAWALTRLARRLEEPRKPDWRTLAGDRDVEWAWSLGHLRPEPGRVIDLGSGNGFLSLAAAFRGHEVVAVDLEPQAFGFAEPRIEYRQGDFNTMELEPRSFDQALCCSTIEHVGIGGRYGSRDDRDADLRFARKVAEVMRSDATVVLTLPVGRDGVYAPYHRVYGRERLPRVLEPFRVLVSEFRVKRESGLWEAASEPEALATQGSSTFYALGLFVLAPAGT